MDAFGSIFIKDAPHVSQFFGYVGLTGNLFCIDSTHQSLFSGYVISDSSCLPGDQTFVQGAILSVSDLTLSLSDWTYANGRLRDDGTYVDGTFGWRSYDPLWLNYAIWYQDYDTSAKSLVGYRYRTPARQNVGTYYAPMVVPTLPGHYEIRWCYQKDSNSYVRELVQPFVSVSNGLTPMPDYPYPHVVVPLYPSDTTISGNYGDPGFDIGAFPNIGPDIYMYPGPYYTGPYIPDAAKDIGHFDD